MAVSDTLINTLFDGRYRILRKLGSGGMANVYLAEDEDLGRRVAIKILNERYANDEVFNERFRREAKSAAALSHPHIVSIYDRGQTDGIPYIAMEVIEGRSLKELILTRGPLPVHQAIAYAEQILDALRFAHRNGIIHRDIKPHNILVGAEDRLKVADFGIARAGASQMTEAGSIMGTAQYLSPEQARGAPVSAASDLYSLGIVLYEMLTGEVPFKGEAPIEIAMKHLNETPRPPSALRPEVPPELDHVVLRALAKNPEERYGSAEEFREDLERVEAGVPLRPETAAAATAVLTGATTPATAVTSVLGHEAGTSVLPPTRPLPPPRRRPPAYPPRYEEPPRKRRRRLLPWLFVLLLLAAAALAGWYVFSEVQDELAASKPVPVPYVLGLKQERAERLIERAGLEADVEREASTEAARGVVFDQDPDAETRIARGETVTITVSTGPPKVEVPDLRGMTEQEARDELAGLNLKANTVERFSERPPGEVIGQDPGPGAEVVEGSTVTLRVSKGEELVVVPDVLQQSRESAIAELEANALEADVREVTSDEPEGLVVDQDPAPGVEASKGSTVRIDVSKGPQAKAVPDVTGQDRERAEEELTDAGFKVTVVEQETADPTEEDRVLEQNPSAGVQAQPGTTVTITVGRFLAPTTTETTTNAEGEGEGEDGGNGRGRGRGQDGEDELP